ncbi:hypothetical protein H0H92_011453, partial [Tricholoma furcatifolium]
GLHQARVPVMMSTALLSLVTLVLAASARIKVVAFIMENCSLDSILGGLENPLTTGPSVILTISLTPQQEKRVAQRRTIRGRQRSRSQCPRKQRRVLQPVRTQ